MASKKLVKIELYDIYPSTLGHCPHYNLLSAEMYAVGSEFCEHSTQVLEYPDEIIKNHVRAVQVLKFLKDSLKNHLVDVELEMVNLISPVGFLKSIRYGVWRRPAIVVNGKKVSEGFIDWEGLKKAVEEACIDRVRMSLG